MREGDALHILEEEAGTFPFHILEGNRIELIVQIHRFFDDLQVTRMVFLKMGDEGSQISHNR